MTLARRRKRRGLLLTLLAVVISDFASAVSIAPPARVA